MTFSDDNLSDHMNRIPLAVFLVEADGGKFYFISAIDYLLFLTFSIFRIEIVWQTRSPCD